MVAESGECSVMQPGVVGGGVGKRNDLIKLQGLAARLGEQSEQRHGPEFSWGSWYKDDPILAEYQVCVGNPGIADHQKKWEASIAILLKPGRNTGLPGPAYE